MLAITSGAAEAIKHIVSSEVSETAGIRISADPTSEHSTTLDVSVAEGPSIGDEVVEEQGANVFVEQRAAQLLDKKVLDATLEGDQVAFIIVEPQSDWSQDGQPKNFDPRSIS